MTAWTRGVALVLIAGLAACSSHPVPQGFVPLVREGDNALWVAPSGTRFELRVLENVDEGTQEFWSQAVLHQLTHVRGYELVEHTECVARNRTKGDEMRFRVRRQLDSYEYWLALFVDGDEVYLAEAAATPVFTDAELRSVRGATLDWGW